MSRVCTEWGEKEERWVDNQRNELEELVARVHAQQLTRRGVLKRAAALGLSAPAIAALLAACGGSSSKETPAATVADTAASTPSPAATAPGASGTPVATIASPTAPATPVATRGGGGDLNILWWQAPAILNAHLSLADKDTGSVRIYSEPLADFDSKTKLVPFLAAEIPSADNGGVAADGTSVTWKLRQGVKWHDGEPFTAADVVFTFNYLSDPKSAATTLGYYQDISTVEAVDDHTVKITFKNPTPAWYNPFTGAAGQILPEHILKDYTGEKAATAPFNLKPIGTGPYKVASFTPGDSVVYEINKDYYEAGKPYFDRVIVKGGGSAESAARAVMQSGESDWAWNLQVQSTVLQSMESGGKGQFVTWPGGGTEKLVINHTDPQTETDGQKSYYQNPHPHFKELKVRQALALSLQRDVIAQQLYGPGGKETGYTLNNNPLYMPKDITWKYDLDAAKKLLDEVGAAPGSDGTRVLNGRKMNWVFTASTNQLRQKEQEIIKAALQQLGIGVEIKAIDAGVYFNAGNEDSFQHLYCDLGIESNAASVFPLLWYLRYLSADPAKDIAQKENGWSGRNIQRYQNPDFNALYAQAGKEVDKDKSVQIFLQMQSLVVNDIADIGMVSRNHVAAASKSLTGYEPTPWALDVWDIKNWKRTK
jgi:peptide/nickel transport system substrate-binding protein